MPTIAAVEQFYLAPELDADATVPATRRGAVLGSVAMALAIANAVDETTDAIFIRIQVVPAVLGAGTVGTMGGYVVYRMTTHHRE